MKNILSYLTFNGNCKEAMHFYKECLGGDLYFQTIGESPMADQMPKTMKDCILHSTLTNGNVVIMATDMVPKNGMIKGNNLSLMVDCESELEIRNLYKVLLVGGHSDHPLEDTFWGAIFGDLTDKYGNHWLLNYTKETTNN
jgi:PhnB protein